MFHKFFYSHKKTVEETVEEQEDAVTTREFQVDPTSSRIYFYKNSILSSNFTNTQYLIKKELGRGAFSNVYLAYAKNKNDYTFDYNKKYVIKTTKYKPLYAEQAVKEYQYYNKIDNQSKYIIYFKDFFSISNKTNITTPCLVLEYFHDNFYTYMKTNFVKNYGLSIDILLILTKSMILGIDFLHNNEIIHCDLKPENIVINNKNQCKIIDLGSAIKSGFNDKNCYMQSRYYRSPNCIVSCDINPRIDYWSIGCIMYEALTLIPLFCKNNQNKVLIKQLRFINIPHDKINKDSFTIRHLYDYQSKKWREYIEKINLFYYLNLVLKDKNIERLDYEKNWLFNTKTGYCSLINMCILEHYNKNENNYVQQFKIVEEMYNNELKFPTITTV